MPVPFREGAPFLDYVLPDHTKTLRQLSALQSGELMLSRGSFCPKEREQLKEVTRFYPLLTVGACRLVVITTEDWQTTNSLRLQLDTRSCTTSRSGCATNSASSSTRTPSTSPRSSMSK